MSNEVRIPDIWEEDEEGVITAWLVDDGAEVESGDTLAEIMVQKVQYELEAPFSGVLNIAKDVDETVEKGDVIATIG